MAPNSAVSSHLSTPGLKRSLEVMVHMRDSLARARSTEGFRRFGIALAVITRDAQTVMGRRDC